MHLCAQTLSIFGSNGILAACTEAVQRDASNHYYYLRRFDFDTARHELALGHPRWNYLIPGVDWQWLAIAFLFTRINLHDSSLILFISGRSSIPRVAIWQGYAGTSHRIEFIQVKQPRLAFT